MLGGTHKKLEVRAEGFFKTCLGGWKFYFFARKICEKEEKMVLTNCKAIKTFVCSDFLQMCIFHSITCFKIDPCSSV